MQLLLGLPNMGKLGIGVCHPWNYPIIEWLRLLSKGIIGSEFALIRRDVGELVAAPDITSGPDVRQIGTQHPVNNDAIIACLNASRFQIQRFERWRVANRNQDLIDDQLLFRLIATAHSQAFAHICAANHLQGNICHDPDALVG